MEETKVEETSRIYPSLSQLKTSEMDNKKHKDRVRCMKNKETQLLLRHSSSLYSQHYLKY